MKPFNKSKDQKKWGLFILLLGSLGFSLSMNPNHFNNIVRNDSDSSGVFELAASEPPAALPKPAAPVDDKAEAEADTKAKAEADTKAKAEADAKAKAEAEEKAKAAKISMEDLKTQITEAVRAATEPQLKELAKNQQETDAKVARLLPEGSRRDTTQPSTQPAANPAGRSGGETGVPTAPGQAASGGTAAAGATNPPKHNISFDLLDKGISCDVEVSKEGSDVKGKVTSKTEAGPCKNGKTYTLKSSIFADIKEIRAELLQKMKDDNSDKTDKELEKEKVAELRKKYDDEAEKCKESSSGEAKEYSEKLECLKNLMVKFSKETKNMKESKSELTSFFKEHLYSSLRSGLNRQLTFDFNGNLVGDPNKLTEAREALFDLVDSMPAKNSGPVTALLANLHKTSWDAQIINAREMYLQGIEEKKSTDRATSMIGMKKEQMGYLNLKQYNLKGTFGNDHYRWMTSLESSGKSDLMDGIKQTLFSPTLTLINSLPSDDAYGKLDSNKRPMAAAALEALNLSSYGSGYPGPNPTFAVPGTIWAGTLEQLQSRLNGQRGTEIPLMTAPRGVGAGVNGRVQTQFQGKPGGLPSATGARTRGAGRSDF